MKMPLVHRLFKHVLLACVDVAATRAPRPLRNGGVLLIRLDAIGDFVLWLDSARRYRELYPQKKITLCTSTLVENLAEGIQHWDKVVSIDVPRFTADATYRFNILKRLHSDGYDVAIQPVYSRVFLHGDAVVRATAATHRIGSTGDNTNIRPWLKKVSDKWYTRLIPATEEPLCELDRNTEFIRNLGGVPFQAALPVLPHLTFEARTAEVPRSPYCVVFPGASWHGRRWPEKYFAAVMDQLRFRHGWTFVICGSTLDVDVCRNVQRQSEATIVNLAGKTSLKELSEVIRGAVFLIGNETSAVHIAAAVGTPSLGILGGGHFGRFLPYPPQLDGVKPCIASHAMPCFNCNWRCTQEHDSDGPVPCISLICVDDVLVEIEKSWSAAITACCEVAPGD